MDDCERYLFDLSGFLHIPGLLSATEAQRLYEAAVELEAHALCLPTRFSQMAGGLGTRVLAESTTCLFCANGRSRRCQDADD